MILYKVHMFIARFNMVKQYEAIRFVNIYYIPKTSFVAQQAKLENLVKILLVKSKIAISNSKSLNSRKLKYRLFSPFPKGCKYKLHLFLRAVNNILVSLRLIFSFLSLLKFKYLIRDSCLQRSYLRIYDNIV
jgi:hypothetical protein